MAGKDGGHTAGDSHTVLLRNEGELAQASSVTALKKPPPPSQPLAALDVTDVADGHRLRPGLGSYTLAA